MSGCRTKDDPWALTTPPGTSDYTMYRARVVDDLQLGLAEVEHNPRNNRMHAL